MIIQTRVFFYYKSLHDQLKNYVSNGTDNWKSYSTMRVNRIYFRDEGNKCVHPFADERFIYNNASS